MTDQEQANLPPENDLSSDEQPSVRSLRELIDRVTGRTLETPPLQEDSGIADVVPFPFLALVGQSEMKLALLLAMINPHMGGVLLIGPRGTGKTTAVRSLPELLPQTPRSLCYYGCLPEDVETGGIDAVCPDCARKYAEGKPLAVMDKVRLVELPLNARLDDVVGGLDERAALQGRVRLRKGILAQADRNLLYVDEVNLLNDDVVDAILDAAAQGYYHVRRGPISATFRSRFVLVGSMNPEEGRLRPQILDRFGLRVIVRGLKNQTERLEAYRRAQAYMANPRRISQEFAESTALAQEDIQGARELLPQVVIPDDVARQVRALVEPPSALLVLISGLEASLQMLELAGRHNLGPEHLHTARDAATALAAGVSTVYTYDVEAWEPFLADGLHIGGPSSVMARWFRMPGAAGQSPVSGTDRT